MSNAFARMVQTRPCPTFGRPVRQKGSLPRLQPGSSPHALRIPPHGGHPALRLSSRPNARRRHPLVRLRRFRLRAHLGFSISFHSPASEVCPAFGYGAPHPSARGTLTLLIIALPSAHHAPIGIDDPRRLPENDRFPASLIDLTGFVVMGQPWYKLMAGADEMPD